MYKAKIKNIEKERHQAKNTDFLKVEFDIVDADGKVLASKIVGLSIGTKKDQVIAEVNKHIVEYGKEVENIKVEAVKAEEEKSLNEMKDNLVGETISVEVDDAEEKEIKN